MEDQAIQSLVAPAESDVWTPPEKTPPSNPSQIGTQHRGMKTRLTNLIGRSDLLDIICDHVASGGTLLDLCTSWRIAFSAVLNWIHEDDDRQMRYDRSLNDRQEWAKARVLKELAGIAFSDIREMYNDNGELLHVKEMPDDVARSVSAVETEEIFDYVEGKKSYVGTTRKVKRWDRIKALELFGMEFGMFRKVIGVGTPKDIEALVAGSWGDKRKVGTVTGTGQEPTTTTPLESNPTDR